MAKRLCRSLCRELGIFRKDYLPILAEPVLIDDRWTYVGTLAAAPGPNARTWEAAAFSIADCLLLPPTDPGKPFAAEDYAGLYQKARDAGFRIRDGKIVWEISIFMPVRLEGDNEYFPYVGRSFDRVDQIVDWLLSLSMDRTRLWNPLCMLPLTVAMEDEERGSGDAEPGVWTKWCARIAIGCR